MFLLDSKFFHHLESDVSVEKSHKRADDDIARVVHPIVDSRYSHEDYNHDSKWEKSFFEIGNNQNEKSREGHMTRWKGRIMEGMTDSEEIWVYRPGTRSKDAEMREEYF